MTDFRCVQCRRSQYHSCSWNCVEIFASYKSILGHEYVVWKIKWLHCPRQNDNINGSKTSSYSFCKPFLLKKYIFNESDIAFGSLFWIIQVRCVRELQKCNRWDTVFVEFPRIGSAPRLFVYVDKRFTRLGFV